jgi:hypothetical protein
MCHKLIKMQSRRGVRISIPVVLMALPFLTLPCLYPGKGEGSRSGKGKGVTGFGARPFEPSGLANNLMLWLSKIFWLFATLCSTHGGLRARNHW